jgi:hypothetical protein
MRDLLANQNRAAETRIRAERELGRTLTDTAATNGDAASMGITVQRARNAVKLAQILDADLDNYIAATISAGR